MAYTASIRFKTCILLQVFTPGIVLLRIILFSRPLFKREAGRSPEHLAFFKGGAETTGCWGGKAYGNGCRPRLGRAQCQGLSRTPFFLGACSDPLLGSPAGNRDMWSVQDWSICPTASVQLMPAPSCHLPMHLMEMTYCCLTRHTWLTFRSTKAVSRFWRIHCSLNLLSLLWLKFSCNCFSLQHNTNVPSS